MIYFKKKRILLACNSLEVYAGVEKRTFELACFLKETGCEVEIIALRCLGKIADFYRAKSIPVHYIPVYQYTDRILPSWFNFMRFVMFLWRKRFGVIISVQPPAHYFSRLATFPPFGRRIFAMERIELSDRSNKLFIMDNILSLWTNKIVCVSEYIRDQLLANICINPSKVVVIENGNAVDPPFDDLSKLKKRLNGQFVFGYCGLLTRRKRPMLALQAFERVLSNHPDCALLLVGDGEESEALQKYASAKQLTQKVIFTGEQQHPHDYYRLFHALVFPSVSEGFPGVLIEAWQHGLPVICADVRPMCDYAINNHNALTFPPDDLMALENRMVILLNDIDLCRRLGNCAKAMATTRFDRDNQLSKLAALFTS